ncbi:MAG: PmoA family protein [Planctomycetota bacterium]
MSVRSFVLKAGAHDRRFTPIRILLSDAGGNGSGGVSGLTSVNVARTVSAVIAPDAAPYKLTRTDTGGDVPCQVSQGKVYFILDELAAGEERTFTLTETSVPAAPVVKLKHVERARRIEIKVGARKFTEYHFEGDHARPYFYPLFGPGRVQITRNFPMASGVAGETQDHPHHRSLWVAYGEVNGTDNWSEEPGHGWQTHQSIARVVDGPVFGEFEERLSWEDREHRRQLEETRIFRVYSTPDSTRLMDLTVALTASEGNVLLKDTKEGGLCSVRVASALDGARGGRIENSYGAVGEAETWGKPAQWCDYSGVLDGKAVGIALMDHPFNLRHPTCWHVRDYGLMTANPFGYSYYKSGLLQDGSYTILHGNTLVFRYRILLHKHDARKARVGERYHDYINPPMVAELK